MSRGTPRVVFFQANFPSSIDYANARPVRRMLMRDLDVHVVAYGARRETVDGVPLWRERSLGRAAARIVGLRPDLLFVETPTTSLALAACARLSWVRSPVMSARRRKATVQRGLLRFVDYATFCNPADETPWRLPARRLLDLPYPVDVRFWSEDVPRRDAWWESRGLSAPTGPVVSYVSNLFAKKRQAEVVEWLTPLLRQRPGARLVIAGRVFDEQVARDVSDAIARLDVADRVHVVGELRHDETRELYAWSDVHLINSRVETQCMALYEGLAAGVPAVVRDTPNLTSAFPHLPAHSDGEQLRAHVARLLDDEAYAASVVTRSRPRVEWADVGRHDRLLDEHLDRLLDLRRPS